MTRNRSLALALPLALALYACAGAGRAPQAPKPGPGWPEKALGRLSLEERAGQLIVTRINGYHLNLKSEAARRIDAQVRELGIGGLIVSRGDPLEMATFLNRLQALAKLPLLVAADFEWGAGVQAPHGATALPGAMAIGAAGSEELAEAHGRMTAREGRAMGVHMTYAPVVDVNNNPDNPIINIRAFGEDPELVGRLAAAFIRGAKAGGMLTTAKHFPGHGDTAVDSHRALAPIAADRERLARLELLPYRSAIAAGVDAVMVGHLAVPALDASGVAATVSRPIVTDVLRGELGFKGLVVTDGMEMRGITDAFEPGEAAVRALEAGQDVILISPDPQKAKDTIVAAVRSGRLSAARLDQSVLRLLRAKQAAGLDRQRLTPVDRVWTEIADPDALPRMQELAERSITLVRNEGGVVPLPATGRLLHVTLSGDPVYEPLHNLPEAEVRARVPRAEGALVDPRTGREERERLLKRAGEVDAVLVSAFVRVSAYRGSAAMSEDLAGFLTELTARAKRLVVISFGSPYLLRQFPAVPGYLCAYGQSALSQRAAMRAAFGEIRLTGRLPVSLPGLYPAGHGLVRSCPGSGSSKCSQVVGLPGDVSSCVRTGVAM
jgi:beta-glucosidase-like glycosyl hydrolase